MDRLNFPEADQVKDSTKFGDGPSLKLEKGSGHLSKRCNYNTECLFTEKELAKLHYRFEHPDVQRMHEFLKKV